MPNDRLSTKAAIVLVAAGQVAGAIVVVAVAAAAVVVGVVAAAVAVAVVDVKNRPLSIIGQLNSWRVGNPPRVIA